LLIVSQGSKLPWAIERNAPKRGMFPNLLSADALHYPPLGWLRNIFKTSRLRRQH
jgi:hypothetical protein